MKLLADGFMPIPNLLSLEKEIYLMKYGCIFLVILMSCHNKQSSEVAKDVTNTPTILALTPLQAAIKSAITKIETQNIESSGNIITPNSLQIEGMEITKISKKDFLINERNSQESDFNNFIHYLERFKTTKSPLNDPNKKIESQAKHKAVMLYLNQQITKASSARDIYRVIYYLKADTRGIEYNQKQTTYLDEHLKNIKVDYSHLETMF